jgi:hypothetical protein
MLVRRLLARESTCLSLVPWFRALPKRSACLVLLGTRILLIIAKIKECETASASMQNDNHTSDVHSQQSSDR